MSQFNQFFEQLCDGKRPYVWQQTLGEDAEIRNRLISIPTGFGKTIGVASAWIYQRVMKKNPEWPRRLVWCLPMRTLVEQTAETLRSTLARNHIDIDVHILMGGSTTRDYHLNPEKEAILVGTQDMLISRALNRGYGVARARCPMEFALLNNDCLWVLDEVQLMDVGLATSAQLQQFRNDDAPKMMRPSYSWWMSATLQPSWLKSVDSEQMVEKLEKDILTLSDNDHAQSIWSNTSKPLHVEDAMDDKKLSNYIVALYQQHEHDQKTILVVVNTVKRAIAVYDAIIKKNKESASRIRLIHSRFRGLERNQWRESFLNKEKFSQLKLIIATQVVEAGVDISADILVTDLAPWASLIQRFGRCARYGGTGEIYVIKVDAKSSLPYDENELSAARDLALSALENASLHDLDVLQASCTSQTIQQLYHYAPQHLLVRHELDELFDTTADLTGADLDISRFIRSGVERDCSVFWYNLDNVKDIEGLKGIQYQPCRDELCSVPVYELDSFIKKVKDKKKDIRYIACVWNYLENMWEELKTNIQPGRIVMLNQKAGGYHTTRGFTGDPADTIKQLQSQETSTASDLQADLAQNTDALSQIEQYMTIAEHGAETIQWGKFLCSELSVSEEIGDILLMALSLHDYGKCHEQFQNKIVDNSQQDLAKAPKWKQPNAHRMINASTSIDKAKSENTDIVSNSESTLDKHNNPQDRWIRHELASALGIIELLAQTNPMHPALLGEWKEYIELGILKPNYKDTSPSDIGKILSELSKDDFNLLIYLVAAHHGKVRASLHATPDDQNGLRENPKGNYDMPIRGIYDNDDLPSIDIVLPDMNKIKTPAVKVHLDIANMGLSNRYGASWSERVRQLIDRFGPFQLSWLESLVRVADIQASKGTQVPDSL